VLFEQLTILIDTSNRCGVLGAADRLEKRGVDEDGNKALLSLWAQGDPKERPEAATSLWLMQMGTVSIMGLIWVGTLFKDKTDGNTYSISRRRVQHGSRKLTARDAPGDESKLPTQSYLDITGLGTLILPDCNCSWAERRSGHVCDRKIWRILERRRRRFKDRRS
jgi:hypothetical protein